MQWLQPCGIFCLASEITKNETVADLPEAYKRYVLIVLTIVLTVSYLDTSLITVLLQPIKVDLSLNDSQLGLLTGIAFAFFYATLGIPIARWADRGNRVSIAAIAIGLWGLTLGLSLFIGNFFQLFVGRVAAGVGQAGCFPPMYSLLGDYFPEPQEKTRAMAILMLAQPISAMGLFLSGWMEVHFGWRLAFVAIGILGVLAAALLKVSVREPRRRRIHASKPGVPFSSVLSAVWHQRSFRHLTFAMMILFVVGQGLNPWYAAFLVRSHGMNTEQVGAWLTVIMALGLSSGTLLGGYIANRLFAGREDLQMRVNALVLICTVPCSALFLLAPLGAALTGLLLVQIAFGYFIGPTLALIQRLVDQRMRATAFALLMLAANLVGMGIGPQLVGVLSDLSTPLLGMDALRFSMLAVSILSLWASREFICVAHTVIRDLEVVSASSFTKSSPKNDQLPLGGSAEDS